MTQYKTFLGLDPGKKNAGIAIVRVRIKNKKAQFRIEECGKLKHLVSDLKVSPKKQLKKHVAEIRGLAKKYKVDYVLAERYMARGRNGATIEYVNQMLGAMEYGLNYDITQIPSSTWKNRVNKFFVLNDFYKSCYRVEPHEIDAIFQAMWLAEKKMEIPLFEKLAKKSKRDKLIKVIMCKTSSPLKRERKPKKR